MIAFGGEQARSPVSHDFWNAAVSGADDWEPPLPAPRRKPCLTLHYHRPRRLRSGRKKSSYFAMPRARCRQAASRRKRQRTLRSVASASNAERSGPSPMTVSSHSRVGALHYVAWHAERIRSPSFPPISRQTGRPGLLRRRQGQERCTVDADVVDQELLRRKASPDRAITNEFRDTDKQRSILSQGADNDEVPPAKRLRLCRVGSPPAAHCSARARGSMVRPPLAK